MFEPETLHPSATPQSATLLAPPRAALQGTVAPTDPERAVRPRAGATIDPSILRVREDAAVKHNTFPSRPGYASSNAHWQTHLHVEAWVRNTTFAKWAWADVHVFAHDGALVGSQTCALEWERPAGDGGDVFRGDCAAYEGATVSPGSAAPRPDVRLVQYRVYCEMDGRLYTDGVLHECLLNSDVISR